MGGTFPCSNPAIAGADTAVTTSDAIVHFGRAHDFKALVPAVIEGSLAFFSLNGTIASSNNFEVGKELPRNLLFPTFQSLISLSMFQYLCGNGFAWQQFDVNESLTIPKTAIAVGNTADDEILYGCRSIGFYARVVDLPGLVILIFIF